MSVFHFFHKIAAPILGERKRTFVIHHQIDRDLITTSKADFKLPTDLTRVAGLIHKEKKEKVATHEVDSFCCVSVREGVKISLVRVSSRPASEEAKDLRK